MSRVSISSGKWIKAADIGPDSTAVILTEADWETGEFKGEPTNQYVSEVDFNGEKRKLKFTIYSRQQMIALGPDSTDWINHRVKLSLIDVPIGGELKKSILVTPLIKQDVQTSAPIEEDTTRDVWDE